MAILSFAAKAGALIAVACTRTHIALPDGAIWSDPTSRPSGQSYTSFSSVAHLLSHHGYQ